MSSEKRARTEGESLFGKGLKAKYLVEDKVLELDSLKGKAIVVSNVAST